MKSASFKSKMKSISEIGSKKKRKSEIPEGVEQMNEEIKKKNTTPQIETPKVEQPKEELKEIKQEPKMEVKIEPASPSPAVAPSNDLVEEEPKPKSRIPSKMKKMLGSESTTNMLSILNKDGRDGVIEGIKSNKHILEKLCECEGSKVIFDTKDTNGNLKDFNKTIMNLSYLCIMAVTGDEVIGCFVRKPIDTINKPISDYKHFVFTFKTGDPLNVNHYLPKGDNWQHAFTLGGNDSGFIYKINTTAGAEICAINDTNSKLINIQTAYENSTNDLVFSGLKNKPFINERIVVLQLY